MTNLYWKHFIPVDQCFCSSTIHGNMKWYNIFSMYHEATIYYGCTAVLGDFKFTMHQCMAYLGFCERAIPVGLGDESPTAGLRQSSSQ